MRSALLMPTFLCLFLLSVTIESRKDLQEYWKTILKDEEMSEGIQGLLQLKSDIKPWVNSKVHEKFAEGFKRDYKESLVTNTLDVIEKKVSTEEFEPAYGDNENMKYKKDFEPRPSASKYGDDSYKLEKPSVNSEFEPRPSLTGCEYDDGNKKEKLQVDGEFEPRPSVTKYDDGNKKEKLQVDGEFEPRPSVTKYGDDSYKSEKLLVNAVTKNGEFEPRPSVTKYDDSYKSGGKLSLNYEFEPRPSVTKYDNHHGYKSDKLPLNSEFEPRPSATKYGDDDYKNEKMQVDDEFEPRPSATKYDE